MEVIQPTGIAAQPPHNQQMPEPNQGSDIIAHLRENFGELSPYLEKEVIRRGLLHRSINSLYEYLQSQCYDVCQSIVSDCGDRAVYAALYHLLVDMLIVTCGQQSAPAVAGYICNMFPVNDCFSCVLSPQFLGRVVDGYFNQQMPQPHAMPPPGGRGARQNYNGRPYRSGAPATATPHNAPYFSRNNGPGQAHNMSSTEICIDFHNGRCDRAQCRFFHGWPTGPEHEMAAHVQQPHAPHHLPPPMQPRVIESEPQVYQLSPYAHNSYQAVKTPVSTPTLPKAQEKERFAPSPLDADASTTTLDSQPKTNSPPTSWADAVEEEEARRAITPMNDPMGISSSSTPISTPVQHDQTRNRQEEELEMFLARRSLSDLYDALRGYDLPSLRAMSPATLNEELKAPVPNRASRRALVDAINPPHPAPMSLGESARERTPTKAPRARGERGFNNGPSNNSFSSTNTRNNWPRGARAGTTTMWLRGVGALNIERIRESLGRFGTITEAHHCTEDSNDGYVIFSSVSPQATTLRLVTIGSCKVQVTKCTQSSPSAHDFSQPCKYFNSRDGCMRGSQCKYQHIPRQTSAH